PSSPLFPYTTLFRSRELEITFALPPQAPHWPAQPYDHITWLLGHEGEGTLFSALTERGWIERLSAYDYEVDDHALLTISADLTRSEEHTSELQSREK